MGVYLCVVDWRKYERNYSERWGWGNSFPLHLLPALEPVSTRKYVLLLVQPTTFVCVILFWELMDWLLTPGFCNPTVILVDLDPFLPVDPPMFVTTRARIHGAWFTDDLIQVCCLVLGVWACICVLRTNECVACTWFTFVDVYYVVIWMEMDLNVCKWEFTCVLLIEGNMNVITRRDEDEAIVSLSTFCQR